MPGLLEQFSKGLFGLAPIPSPNGVFGQALDSAAQWGRGVQDKGSMLSSTLADLLRDPSSALPNIPPHTLANLLQQPVTPEMKQQVAQKALDFGMEFGPLTFIGPSAKTWNKVMAQKAQELDAAGVDARKIWQETGTWKAPDGQWRQEIPDSEAIPGHRLYSWGEAADLAQGNSTVVRRQKALLHPQLSAAYPETKNIGVVVKPGMKGGSYDIDYKNITVGAEKNGAVDRSTMIHELQHAIQQKEGFAKGGSPENFDTKAAERARDILSYRKELDNYIAKNWPNAKNEFEVRMNADNALRQEYYRLGAHDMLPSQDIIREAISPNYNAGKAGRQQLEQMVKEFGLDKKVTPNSAMDMYRLLAGEAEARATQARLPMNSAQRRATFPADSYDVPLDQLIIRR